MLVGRLISKSLAPNDSTYHQNNSCSEDTLLTAQKIICKLVCCIGHLQVFKTWSWKKYGLSTSQTLLSFKTWKWFLVRWSQLSVTRKCYLHGHNSHCHIIRHMTKDSLYSLFLSCPEPILEPESACKWMEWKRINLWSETALAGDFNSAPGPPKSAQFPTPAPELSELRS